MSYRAPVDELRFTLEEVAAFEGLKATGAFPDFTADLTGAILEEAANVLAPLNRVGDAEHCKLSDGAVKTPSGFPEAYAQFVEGGWQGLQFPSDLGGMGLPRALGVAVLEMIQGANLAFGLGPMLTYGGIEALIEHGSDELKERYLGRPSRRPVPMSVRCAPRPSPMVTAAGRSRARRSSSPGASTTAPRISSISSSPGRRARRKAQRASRSSWYRKSFRTGRAIRCRRSGWKRRWASMVRRPAPWNMPVRRAG